MPDSKEWISSKEGADLLGIPQPNYLYYARTGAVRTRPGQRFKEYSLADTLQLRKQLQKPRPVNEPTLIDWMYEADVPAGLKLSQLVYDEDVDLAEAALYQGWRKNNPLLTIAAFNYDRAECYATIQLVPLPETVIIDVLRGSREESSIRPDEIRPYDAPGGYSLLATSATARPERPLLLYELIYRYTQFWLDEMYPDKWIQKIYAQSVSDSGEHLVQHMFMTPRPDLAYNAYQLDIARPSASKIIRQFKRRMEDKAPLPLELQWPPITPQEHIEAPRPPTPITTRPRPDRVPVGPVNEMPDELIGWREYARQTGIAEKDVLREIRGGRILVHKGAWKVGRAVVREAIDAEGRKKVDELHN